MIHHYQAAPNVSATLCDETYVMTITGEGAVVVFDDGDDFRPMAGLSDREAAATLLSFYSAFAEGGPDSTVAPDGYSADQWAALEMVGSDGFYMFAEGIVPTCAEGCGAFVPIPGAPCAHCARRARRTRINNLPDEWGNRPLVLIGKGQRSHAVNAGGGVKCDNTIDAARDPRVSEAGYGRPTCGRCAPLCRVGTR